MVAVVTAFPRARAVEGTCRPFDRPLLRVAGAEGPQGSTSEATLPEPFATFGWTRLRTQTKPCYCTATVTFLTGTKVAEFPVKIEIVTSPECADCGMTTFTCPTPANNPGAVPA